MLNHVAVKALIITPLNQVLSSGIPFSLAPHPKALSHILRNLFQEFILVEVFKFLVISIAKNTPDSKLLKYSQSLVRKINADLADLPRKDILSFNEDNIKNTSHHS